MDKKGNRIFLDIQVGNARQWTIVFTAWAKANGLGNILSEAKFTGAPIFPLIAAARVEIGQPVFNDLDVVSKYSHNIAMWTEKCDRLLSALLTTLGDGLQQHLRQLHDNFTEGSKENISRIMELVMETLGSYSIERYAAVQTRLNAIPPFMSTALITSGLEEANEAYLDQAS